MLTFITSSILCPLMGGAFAELLLRRFIILSRRLAIGASFSMGKLALLSSIKVVCTFCICEPQASSSPQLVVHTCTIQWIQMQK